MRLKTAGAMRQLAGLTADTVATMLSLPIGEDGLACGLTGTLDELNAGDLGRRRAELLGCCAC